MYNLFEACSEKFSVEIVTSDTIYMYMYVCLSLFVCVYVRVRASARNAIWLINANLDLYVILEWFKEAYHACLTINYQCSSDFCFACR